MLNWKWRNMVPVKMIENASSILNFPIKTFYSSRKPRLIFVLFFFSPLTCFILYSYITDRQWRKRLTGTCSRARGQQVLANVMQIFSAGYPKPGHQIGM